MKVIIAIDQSAYWIQIIESVLKRPWPADTQFKVLTVIAPFQWEHFNTPEWEKSAKRIYEARKEAAHEMAMHARKMLQDNIPNAQVHVEIDHGSPRDQILRAAVGWMADKIVIGAHGDAANRLFGAVPQAMATHAPCSIELVRLTNPSCDDVRELVHERNTIKV